MKKALGRSLEELLPDLDGGEIFLCPVDEIRPNPYQPRSGFGEDLEALADSIKRSGVLQPVGLRRSGDGYELVFGERRWRAAILAGLERIPAVLVDAGDRDMLLYALYENLLRKDLNPIEEGEAYRKLSQEFGLSHEEIGRIFGKDRSTVTNYIRLLSLPDKVKELISKGVISPGHGRAILSLGDPSLMERVVEEVVKKELSVRETERLVASLKGKGRESGRRTIDLTKKYEEYLSLLKGLARDFRVRGTRKGLKLEISFPDSSSLEKFLEKVKEVLH